MAGGYDGSIRIDSSIDPKGFNAGLNKIATGFKGIMGKIGQGVSKVGMAALSVGSSIVSIGSALVAAGVIAFKIFEKITMDMYRALSPASAYYDKVTSLKGAFDTLKGATQAMFSSLLSAATPALTWIINSLIKVINFISMVIAALSGQKTVMQYVSGAAQQTAKGTGAAAKNADKLAKAAKGALSAFDEINVLQMQQADMDSAGDLGGGFGGGGGNMMFEEVAIDSKILETVEKIKTWFKDAWENIKRWAGIAWDWIKQAGIDAWTWIKQAAIDTANWIVTAWENVKLWFAGAWEWIKQAASDAWEWIKQAAFDTGEWIKQAWEDVKQWFSTAWENIKQAAIDTWTGIQNAWQGAKDWFDSKVLQPLINWFKQAWEDIKAFPGTAWEKIKEIWSTVSTWFQTTVVDPISTAFDTAWGKITEWVTGAWEDIKVVWQVVSTWFEENIIDPLETAWETFTDWLGSSWETTWGGVKDFAKNTINTIIDFINAMIRAVAGGLNSVIGGLNTIKVTIPSWVPELGGETWGLNLPLVEAPQIPRLAKGAVIPPNAEFLALLGEQKSGRNLEMPEALLNDMLDRKLSEHIGEQRVRIEFGGTMSALVQAMKPYVDRENQRVGRSLIKGGAS